MFFQRTDPDFRPEWAGPHDLIEIYFDYARCSPASPGWRSYFLPRLIGDLGVPGGTSGVQPSPTVLPINAPTSHGGGTSVNQIIVAPANRDA